MKSTLKSWHLLLLGAILLLTISLTIRGCVVEWQLKHENADINASRMQSDLELKRAVSREANLQKELEKVPKNWQQVIKENQELVQAVGVLEGKLNSASQGEVKVILKYRDRIVEKEVKVYIKNPEGNVEELTSFPFEIEDFRLKLQGDAVRKTYTYSLQQRFAGTLVTTLTGKTPTYYFTLKELNDKDEVIAELELEKFDVAAAPVDVKNTFRWFDPHLEISAVLGISTALEFHAVGELGVNFMSWGPSSADNILRVLKIGIGVCGKECGMISITPVSYNIAKQLPLLSDLWIGLTLGYVFPDNTGGFGISIGSTL